MKSTPSSGSRFRTAWTAAGSLAGPQTPSPPILNVPDAAAEIVAMVPTLARGETDLAPEPCPGVFAVEKLDRLAPYDAGERHHRAVTAHVDPSPQAARPAQLAAHRDLLGGLVLAPQRALDSWRPCDDRRHGAQLGLQIVNGLSK